jgi:glucose-1-phosphate adenylyltransferase
VDEDNKIIEFEEKPDNPKNNMASMGIYMFKWEVLRKYLIKDDENPDSDNDFGKNVLPLMLADGNKMFAWVFEGYWKDVGTVRSYWEANMDLLDHNNTLNLYDKDWRIYTRSRNLPPQYIARGSDIKESLVNEGCYVMGEVKRSILFSDVIIEAGAIVKDSVILSNCVIKKGAKIYNSVILEGVNIEEDKIIGEEGDSHIYMVSDKNIIME